MESKLFKQRNQKLIHDFIPFFKVYEDGQIEKYKSNPKFVAPGDDLRLGVVSKDVIISTKPSISARIFMPQKTCCCKKLPLLVYFHGGGFTHGSAFSPVYHNYVASLASKVKAVVVSVEYRLAFEHPIPACYEDALAAFSWVVSHAGEHGPDKWLNDWADFRRLYMAGDSAGANIVHNVAVKKSSSNSNNWKLKGLIFVHPFFSGTKFDPSWFYLSPKSTKGLEDPRFKPRLEDLNKIVCEKLLVVVAGNDSTKQVGWSYVEMLRRVTHPNVSEEISVCRFHEIEAEIIEQDGVGHVYHLSETESEQALKLMEVVSCFINDKEEYKCWTLRCKL